MGPRSPRVDEFHGLGHGPLVQDRLLEGIVDVLDELKARPVDGQLLLKTKDLLVQALDLVFWVLVPTHD